MPSPPIAPRLLDEPYRLFFPLGVLWATIGVGFWLLKGHLPALDDASTKIHVWIQIYGFMGAFILGFLATAIPRFADVPHLRPADVLLLAAFHTATNLAILAGHVLAAHVAFGLTMLLLGSLLVVRLIDPHTPFPPSFLFVPCGLLAAIAGSTLQAVTLAGFGWNVKPFADVLLFQGFVTYLILGIGGFLIRNVLGVPAPPAGMAAPAPAAAPPPPLPRLAHEVVALGIGLGLWLEAYVSHAAGAGLRAALVTVECLGQLGIHRRPKSGKLGAHWLRLALWLLLAGQWADALLAGRFPAYRLAILHLTYVGGFSIITIAIATRVVLSHTGHGALLLRAYRPFSVAQTLLLIGLVARIGADLAPSRYHMHLLYASACWLLGLAVWTVAILARIRHRTAPP